MREGWTYKKLGDICEVINGFAFKSEKYVDKGIRVMRITNVQKGTIVDNDPKYYPNEEAPNIRQYLLNENDLLMSLTGNVGRVGLLQKELLPAALNQRVACLRIKSNDVLLKYLFHILDSDLFEKDCIFNSSGIAQKNMSTEWLKKYTIPVPPIGEQERIVAELDLLSGIIEKKKEQLKAYDQLAQSIFYTMFGDPIDNPKGWETKKLRDCFIIGSGGTPSKAVPEYWENGEIPWIGSNMCQNCIIEKTDGKFITEEGLNHSSAKVLESGTVLVALVGATIGKVALLKTNTAINQNIAFIQLKKTTSFIPEFVYYHLMGQYDEFMNIGDGKFKMANQAFIKSLSICIPPLSLQQEFAEKVEAIERQKALVQQSIDETQTMFDYTMDKYFG